MIYVKQFILSKFHFSVLKNSGDVFEKTPKANFLEESTEGGVSSGVAAGSFFCSAKKQNSKQIGK